MKNLIFQSLKDAKLWVIEDIVKKKKILLKNL